MHFPMLVISYGNFVQTYKLFFYEVFGIGCMPVFTDPTVANLFLKSVHQRMGDMLVGKPELCIMACSNKSHALDMFQNIAVLVPDVSLIELNPEPLTDECKEKLNDYAVPFDSRKYELSEIIELLEK